MEHNDKTGCKRKYAKGEIIVNEYGCRDIETLESPFTEASGKDVLMRDRAKIKITSETRATGRPDVGEKEDEIEFEVADVSPAIANMFRRTIMMEIPTVAIDVVLFYENDGVVFDEALAHRIGLVPLDIDAERLNNVVGAINTTHPDPRTTLKFTLDITAPRDNFQVYSSDLKYVPLEGAPEFETEPQPVHKKILLAKLAKGHRIRASCFAIKGTGSQHAKWSPAACVTYKPLPIVRVKGEVGGAAADYVEKRCPAKVFDIEDGLLAANRPEACVMCRECIRTDTEKGVHVELGLQKTVFAFRVESVGIYRARHLFSKALHVYAAHLRYLSREVDIAWPARLTERTDPSREDYL